MQNGPVEAVVETVADNSSAIAAAFSAVTPQVVQEGFNSLVEGAQHTITAENAQGLLSSLLESGSDVLGSVCEAVSDNPITAGFTLAVGAGTLVGGYFLRNHLKNKAAAAKNEKKDETPAAGNDPSLNAANTSVGASTSNSSPMPGEEESQPRRSSSTSPKLKRSGSGSGHNSD